MFSSTLLQACLLKYYAQNALLRTACSHMNSMINVFEYTNASYFFQVCITIRTFDGDQMRDIWGGGPPGGLAPIAS